MINTKKCIFNNKVIMKCAEIDCNIKYPCFNYIGKTKALYCSKHKLDGMIDVLNKRCIEEDCDIISSYNNPGETKVLYCSKHKKDGMIDILNKRCIESKCNIRPNYNKSGEIKGLYCSKHKLDGMIDVLSKTCLEEDCDIRANFNNPGEIKGLYCSKHKLDGMIDIISKTCLEKDCNIRANFNNPGEIKGLYCKEHKLDEIVNIKNKRCVKENCNIIPTYNKPGETKALYCKEHKLNKMIDVINRSCLEEDCKIRPIYNKPGEIKGLYCAKHKLDGMIDVSNKHCLEPDCDAKVYYGFPGKSKTKCTKHKLSDMIKNPNKECEFKGCSNIAIYGELLERKTHHCEYHKIPGEINLLEKKCSSCNLLNILYENNLCVYCVPERIKRVTKLKEHKIAILLKHNNLIPLSHDKMIDHGECSRRRPDFLFETPTHWVILEIDEFQHKAEHYSCECFRIIDIVNAFGGKPTFFLRYNPDSFKSWNGRKKEISEIKRHEILIKALQSCLNLPPNDITEFIRIRYLFYDGYIDNDTSFEIIDLPGKMDISNPIYKDVEMIDIEKLKISKEKTGYSVRELHNISNKLKIEYSTKLTKESLANLILENLNKKSL